MLEIVQFINVKFLKAVPESITHSMTVSHLLQLLNARSKP